MVHTQGQISAHAEIAAQQAEIINNIGRDQYIKYIAEHDSFLRQIAATRSRARWLIVCGFLLFISGVGVYGWALLRYITVFQRGFASADPAVFSELQLFGPEVSGVPVGLIGFAAAGVGVVLMMIGIVLHVVAAARHREVDRRFSWLYRTNAGA